MFKERCPSPVAAKTFEVPCRITSRAPSLFGMHALGLSVSGLTHTCSRAHMHLLAERVLGKLTPIS